VPQPTTLPRAPEQTIIFMLKLFSLFHIFQDIKNGCSSGKQATIKSQN
jgi:hypothetical protein